MGETDEDRAYEKESWRVRSMIRCVAVPLRLGTRSTSP